MEAISRSCLPAAAARTKRQRKATCCGVLGAASHRTTCSRSSAAKLTSGLILAMRTHISYWPQYVYLFMIHTTRSDVLRGAREAGREDLSDCRTGGEHEVSRRARAVPADYFPSRESGREAGCGLDVRNPFRGECRVTDRGAERSGREDEPRNCAEVWSAANRGAAGVGAGKAHGHAFGILWSTGGGARDGGTVRNCVVHGGPPEE